MEGGKGGKRRKKVLYYLRGNEYFCNYFTFLVSSFVIILVLVSIFVIILVLVSISENAPFFFYQNVVNHTLDSP